jgi:hypothetical protein
MHDTYSNAYFRLGCVNAEDRCEDIFLRKIVSNFAADFTADTANGSRQGKSYSLCFSKKNIVHCLCRGGYFRLPYRE